MKPVQTLYIKDMVCNRCIRVVDEELRKLGHDVRSISLGEVVIARQPNAKELANIKLMLEQNGFELIEDKRAKTIERIKQTILKLVRRDAEEHPLTENYSTYIAKELGAEYHSLSALFSSMESVTIEQYIILQKIERVKELLKYRELTLSEISYKLGYSSVAHLSNQFKKVTGMTPSEFKKLVENKRTPLDKVASLR
jgi:AraC-like DNA-binding protein